MKIPISMFLLISLLNVPPVLAQAPRPSNLKKVLVLDKNMGGVNGYAVSRRDFNAAISELGAANDFAITTIGQTDDMNAFTASRLAEYQVVLFNNNEGLDRLIPANLQPGFETWVRNGGGFIAIHMASAFLSDWPFMSEALVQSFYGPHGTNQPTANLMHDLEGLHEGKEESGILRGLTAPTGFLDEFISFRTTPRGNPGVTILVTVDEKSYSKAVNGPMGSDHPVVWTKRMGKGRVVHNSLGFSWSTTNVYAQKDGYLKKLLFNSLRYAAGDFTGCTDSNYMEYSPDATQSNPAACKTALGVGMRSRSWSMPPDIDYPQGNPRIRVDIHSEGPHGLSLADISGKKIWNRTGRGAVRYSLPAPGKSGLYFLRTTESGISHTRRILVP